MGRQCQYIIVGNLPPVRSCHRPKITLHFKSLLFVMAPPSGKPLQIGLMGMFLMDKDSSDVTWPGIEILVTAPSSKVHPPFMEPQRNIANRMGKIKAYPRTCFNPRFRNGLERSEEHTSELQSRPHL